MPNLPSRDFLQNLDIKEGETINMDCPKCDGVKKFSVSNLDGMLLYNCYRASCDVKGSFLTNMLVDTIKQKLSGDIEGQPHQKFEMPEQITDGDNAYVQRFKARWDLMIDLLYDVKDKRAVFPIYKNGRLVDAIGRALYDSHPKWYKYGKSGKYYSYCINPCRKIAVVVEDCVSATVVGQNILGVTGVALLGTNLLREHKEYLDTFDKIIVALDPDALGKTIEYTKELKSYCDPSQVMAMHIEDDIKYKREADMLKLKELVNA